MRTAGTGSGQTEPKVQGTIVGYPEAASRWWSMATADTSNPRAIARQIVPVLASRRSSRPSGPPLCPSTRRARAGSGSSAVGYPGSRSVRTRAPVAASRSSSCPDWSLPTLRAKYTRRAVLSTASPRATPPTEKVRTRDGEIRACRPCQPAASARISPAESASRRFVFIARHRGERRRGRVRRGRRAGGSSGCGRCAGRW